MNILIADDEKYVRLELRSLLEELLPQAEIEEAENGSQLKEKLDKGCFHMAFVDIRMPGRSGLEILKEYDLPNHETIVIILSGYSEFSYARQAITLGVSEYMLKPVTRDELLEVIKKLLPSVPLRTSESENDSNLVHDAEKVIYKRYKEQIGVAQIAEELNVSPNYLSSQFKKYRNQTLTSFITDLRLNTGKEMLQLPGANVKHIAESLGYQSSRHFARLFREKFNKSPSEYIKESRI